MQEKKIIYADHAATTALRAEALEAMMPYLTEEYGNASSLHERGQSARNGIESGRRTLASLLGAKPNEIFFTSGGTESDNWAIRGTAEAELRKPSELQRRHVITSVIEHPAVLHTCRELEQLGFAVTYLSVDEYGRIRTQELEKALTENTLMVSVMTANNEIGTIQDLKTIGDLCRKTHTLFHTDAVQAFGKIPLDVNECGLDLLSISSHKFYGPKGVGALYVRTGTEISSFMKGGSQERKRRAGTENTAGIAGMCRAAELACSERGQMSLKLRSLAERLEQRLIAEIPGTHLNSRAERKTDGLVNVRFDGIEGESLAVLLDMAGICVSTASACEAGAVEPSHVLKALGLSDREARSAVRISFGRENTEADVDEIADALKRSVDRLRAFSPA